MTGIPFTTEMSGLEKYTTNRNALSSIAMIIALKDIPPCIPDPNPDLELEVLALLVVAIGLHITCPHMNKDVREIVSHTLKII